VQGGLSRRTAGRRVGLITDVAASDWGKRLSDERLNTASHRKMARSLRRAWSACVRRQPSVGRATRATKDSPTVYRKLSICDADWLKAVNGQYKDRDHGKRISAKWLAKATASLKSAHASLLAFERPVQITWTKLLDISGVGTLPVHDQNAGLATLRVGAL
jgi:hypothetical protein